MAAPISERRASRSAVAMRERASARARSGRARSKSGIDAAIDTTDPCRSSPTLVVFSPATTSGSGIRLRAAASPAQARRLDVAIERKQVGAGGFGLSHEISGRRKRRAGRRKRRGMQAGGSGTGRRTRPVPLPAGALARAPARRPATSSASRSARQAVQNPAASPAASRFARISDRDSRSAKARSSCRTRVSSALNATKARRASARRRRTRSSARSCAARTCWLALSVSRPRRR